MQRWFSGYVLRPAGSGGGSGVRRAAAGAEPADGGAQSAHGASAGGPCGVRGAVGAVDGAGVGGGYGPRPPCGGRGPERPQSVHPPQPALRHGDGRGGGGGLRGAAAGRGRPGGAALRDAGAHGGGGPGGTVRVRRGAGGRLCVPLRLLSLGWAGRALAAGGGGQRHGAPRPARGPGRRGAGGVWFRLEPAGRGVAEPLARTRAGAGVRTGSR